LGMDEAVERLRSAWTTGSCVFRFGCRFCRRVYADNAMINQSALSFPSLKSATGSSVFELSRIQKVAVSFSKSLFQNRRAGALS
jgi:hypothetical protein